MSRSTHPSLNTISERPSSRTCKWPFANLKKVEASNVGSPCVLRPIIALDPRVTGARTSRRRRGAPYRAAPHLQVRVVQSNLTEARPSRTCSVLASADRESMSGTLATPLETCRLVPHSGRTRETSLFAPGMCSKGRMFSAGTCPGVERGVASIVRYGARCGQPDIGRYKRGAQRRHAEA